jgi:TonB family protein
VSKRPTPTILLFIYGGSILLHGALAVGAMLLPQSTSKEAVAIELREAKKAKEPPKPAAPPPPPPVDKPKPPPPPVAQHAQAKVSPEAKTEAPPPMPVGADGYADLGGLALGNADGPGLAVPTEAAPTAAAAAAAPTATATTHKVEQLAASHEDICVEPVVRPKRKVPVVPKYTLEARQAEIEGGRARRGHHRRDGPGRERARRERPRIRPRRSGARGGASVHLRSCDALQEAGDRHDDPSVPLSRDMISRTRLSALAALAIATQGTPVFAQPAPPAAAATPQRSIVPPKLVHFVEAEFPASEAAAGRGATVVLQIAITATGSVADVRVLESASPAFDVAALEAARQFVFEPALVNGAAIPVKITYRYVFTFKEKIVKKVTGDFAGVVRNRANKKPMANVRVALDTGQQTLTDDQGTFSIPDVAPGEHAVTLSGEQLATVGTTETFEAAKRIDATYEVELKKEKSNNPDEEEEIVVTAPRIKKQVVSTMVAAEQATRVPGTQGDVLKVVENLPGVARAAVGTGNLVVWGSAPQDTRVYVDGIQVPRLYHDGGYRSIVNSDFVRSVELIPGGYGSEFGRGLGGLVTVALKPLDDEGIHGSVAADTIDASAAVRAKLGDLHVAVAARKSYLDSVVDGVISPSVAQFVPIPKYWDGQARVVYNFGPHETLEAGGLLSSDQTTRGLLNPEPSLTTSQTADTDFNRVYLRYEKHMADGSIVQVTPSFGTNYTSLVNLYGLIPTDLSNNSSVFQFRAGWRGPVLPFLRASVGLDAEATASSLSRLGVARSAASRGGPLRLRRGAAGRDCNFGQLERR